MEPPALLRRELLPPPERIRRFFSLIEERLGAATAYDGVLAVGADIVYAFAWIGAGGFVFAATLFVSNAAFNALGRPGRSTLSNVQQLPKETRLLLLLLLFHNHKWNGISLLLPLPL